jgi:RNA-directed DNA polymerase
MSKEPLGTRAGEAAAPAKGVDSPKAREQSHSSGVNQLVERVVEETNIEQALKKVRANAGAAGVDRMTVEALPQWMEENWRSTREEILGGTYRPQPIKQQMIPKEGGGERMLGIPTVRDRLIQQAILQVIQPIIDPTLSEHSYGFRPGRSAQQAVQAARAFVEAGKRWVVDVDLEKFFDQVNHDILMDRVSRRIEDKMVLKLIRRYLQAGVMAGGLEEVRVKGTPQGGPLSPILTNVLLDEVDRVLESRGHSFARYADDCNVYVESERAGQRVMQSLVRLYEQLKLKVNKEKSAVAEARTRKFLGFTIRMRGTGAGVGAG